MILDATTKKLQVVLGGAITSAQLQVNVSWADTQNGATFVPGSNSAVTNSGTPVDIVAAPAASTQRQVKEVTVQNTDTAAATVTVQTVDGANTRKNIVVTIQVGETLFFAAGQWGVLATNGAIKGSAGVSSVALTMPSVIFNTSVPGSPITTTGTLAPTLATQTANTLLAGPTTGAAATPTFRTVVAGDLNSLALTSGGLVFGGAGGGLAQDASNAFWDATNHRLGIGTATPGCFLDVWGAQTSVPAPQQGATSVRIVSGSLELDRAAINAAIAAVRYNGTFAVPSAVSAADIIFRFTTRGYTGAALSGVTGSFALIAVDNFSPTAQGTKVLFSTVTTGTTSASLHDSFTIWDDARFQANGARVDLSYSKQTPLTGFSITPADTVENLILTPAGVLATGTIIMPANPKDGQYFTAVCTQVVTTLTMNPNAGQTLLGGLAAFTANGFASWIYVASTTTWYRRG